MSDASENYKSLIEAVESLERYGSRNALISRSDVVALIKKPHSQVWRPIETAPKDGTWVLLNLCKKGDDFNEPIYVVRTGWYDDENKEWTNCYATLYPPTHWMPNPSPPVMKEEGR